MRRTLMAAVALLAGVSVAGCASTVAGQAVVGPGQIASTTTSAASSSPVDTGSSNGPSSSAPSSSAPSTADSSTADSSTSTSSSSDSSSSDSGGSSGASDKIPQATFGQPLTLGKGIVVTVAAGTPYTPSSSAATGLDAKHFLKFGFTVANHTAAAFDLSDIDVDALSAGSIGSMVFDSINGIGPPPKKMLAPNQSATFPIALGVNDTADVTLQVRAGFNDPPGLVLSKPPSTAPKSAAPATSGKVPFGQTFRCAGGVAITAAKPAPFTPSPSAAYTKAAAYVSVMITVTNDTGAPFAMSEMDIAMKSDNTESDAINDNGVSSAPPDIVLPNTGTVTFTAAFSVANPNKLELSVAPTYDDDPAVFATG